MLGELVFRPHEKWSNARKWLKEANYGDVWFFFFCFVVFEASNLEDFPKVIFQMRCKIFYSWFSLRVFQVWFAINNCLYYIYQSLGIINWYVGRYLAIDVENHSLLSFLARFYCRLLLVLNEKIYEIAPVKSK